MILFLRPVGRGNWGLITIAIKGLEADFFKYKRNERITLIDRVYRIVKVVP